MLSLTEGAMGDIKGSEEVMDVVPAPDSLFKPLTFPYKLLYGPGPSNVSPRVLKMASLPVMDTCMLTSGW